MIPVPLWLFSVGGWIKSAAAWLWSLVTTYPRTSLAIAACVAAWFAHGWDVDRKLAAQAAAFEAEKLASAAAFNEAADRKRAEVADLEREQEQINKAWTERERTAKADADARLQAALKKVPNYVTTFADSRCIVPVGFLQYAAESVRTANGDQGAGRSVSAEAIPEEALELVDRPSGVPLSAVSRWQRKFATVAGQWRERALMCDRWVDEQAAKFNQPSKPPEVPAAAPAAPPEPERKESNMKALAIPVAALLLSTAAVMPADADAQTAEMLTACSKMGDGETQRKCLDVVMIDRVQRGMPAVPAQVAPQQAAAPVVVNAEPSTFGGWVGKALWSGVTGLFNGVERVAPVAAQVYTAKVGARASERVAEFSNATLQTAFTELGTTSRAGFNANQGIATAGFTALASIPASQTYNVGGPANFGPGIQTVQTHSGNTTRTCTGGAGAAAGNSGGTAGGAGGAGGTGGPANC